MESTQTSEFRPLILVAEDDDSNFKLIKAIIGKKCESNTTIPIIMQTAYAFSSDKENAMKAGATEVLVKPITLGVLRGTLSKYLPDLQW